MTAKKSSTRKKGGTKAASTKPSNGGRPTIRTDENREAIIRLVLEGYSLRRIGRMEGMPDRMSIMRWMADDASFSSQYARAWAISADADVEDIYDIADDGTNDWNEKYDRDGNFLGWQENHEAISRSKLRVEVRKWAASKKRPKKYGPAPEPYEPTPEDNAKLEGQSIEDLKRNYESYIRN